MTFYIKRPGQESWDVEPDGGDILGDLAADTSEWSLHLPHQCGAWEIGYGTLDETLAEAREFRAGLDEAIRMLEQEQAQDGQEPARYAAARVAAARSLRALGVSAAEAGLNMVAGVARWQAESLEQPSPFASMATRQPAPDPSTGCYAASWGWVHVRPACRCVR